MRTAESIYPDVLPLLPSVPEPRVERALLRAAQELCKRARVWREWTEPMEIDEPGEYDVMVPRYSRVEVVEAMTVNGHARCMVPWGFVDTAPDDAKGGDIQPGRLRFQVGQGIPAGSEVRFRLVLAPTDRSPGIPDDIYDLYSELLIKGVCGICMADRDKPWTDLQMSAVYSQQFADGVSRVGVREWRGHTDGTRRARIGWC